MNDRKRAGTAERRGASRAMILRGGGRAPRETANPLVDPAKTSGPTADGPEDKPQSTEEWALEHAKAAAETNLQNIVGSDDVGGFVDLEEQAAVARGSVVMGQAAASSVLSNL